MVRPTGEASNKDGERSEILRFTETVAHCVTKSSLNDFHKLPELLYFCANGIRVHPEHPSKRLSPDSVAWLEQFEHKLPGPAYDDAGRLHVAEQYALGYAAQAMKVLLRHCKTWAALKKEFLVWFPRRTNVHELFEQLLSTKMISGESVECFGVRLLELVDDIKRADELKEYPAVDRRSCEVFIKALPIPLRGSIHDAQG